MLTVGDGQHCHYTIAGKVLDQGTSEPLGYVSIYVQESSARALTAEDGTFAITDLCHGDYHLIFSHIGCEPQRLHYHIEHDTTLTVYLDHTPTALDEVVIGGQRSANSSRPSLSINRAHIEDNANAGLSQLIETEAGVHLLRNGAIAKPVVNGLYGNRLTILNNGIVQSGQQWGNDHSPEIDAFALDKVTVLKGVSAIEYGGANLGAVVLTEPKRIPREPHLHGQVNYIYDTNGRGNTVNTRLEKHTPTVAWRLNASLKQYGDLSTADYYLNNTGSKEASLALQLEKSWNDRLFAELYMSTFNTALGVLRGSQIGNLTDLRSALVKDVPFFTEDEFSYAIDAPYQSVSHHLAKGKLKYYITDDKTLQVTVAGQSNDRKEYDIRRGGRSETPALSLQQYAFTTDSKYSQNMDNGSSLNIGHQLTVTDNTNVPETGILPLIPDYLSWENSSYVTYTKEQDKYRAELGVRYEYEGQSVRAFSITTPREIERYANQFHNVSASASYRYDFTSSQWASISTGYATRNPAINELYSRGLHQGVSGIEEGDTELVSEQLLKTALEYKWLPSQKFSIGVLASQQYFQDYIFLNPQDEIRLTIRGAFPVFKYEQTDASITSLDIQSQFTISNALIGKLNYSYLRGTDTTADIPLVFMPPNSFYGSLTYQYQKRVNLGANITMDDIQFQLDSRLVLRQGHLLANQDFAEAPDTYQLMGIKLSSNIYTSTLKLRCFINVDNLLNTRYRDYLNRQRYFADDLGRSVRLGANVKF